jgi:hypothetical protein
MNKIALGLTLLLIQINVQAQTNDAIEISKKKVIELKESNKRKVHDMERVDTTFLKTAPFIITGKQKIKASREEVFQFLKVAENWPKWHNGITKVIWTSALPFEKGTTRTVEINGKYIADEEFLVWEENYRFNFIFLRSNIPMAVALMEDFVLNETEDGYCELNWSVAGKTSGILKLFNGLMKRINEKGIKESAENLAEIFENEQN